jgi:mannose-6-phosphate isomerase
MVSNAEPVHAEAVRSAIRLPLPLAYHPLYRFYAGGALTREFRGEPERPDDWWSEDWVGSCTLAGNTDPDGRAQGLSTVEVPRLGAVTLKQLVEWLPAELVGERFAARFGPITGVLVKLLSPAGPVPVHAHPTRAWAREHLGSPFGKAEAWILLDTPGDGRSPAHASIGFVPGIDRQWFSEAVRRHDSAAIRGALHRTEVAAGEVYVAFPGVPHCLGPRLSFIEVQEPTDHIVIAETASGEGAGADGSGDDGSGDDAAEAAATMGLGWEVALDMIDYSAAAADETFARARQQRRILRQVHGSSETRLVGEDVLPFFDATALDVTDEIDVGDGRFSIAIVTAGSGLIETDAGVVPVRRGQTFALAATLQFRLVAGGDEPLRVVRCLGPSAD